MLICCLHLRERQGIIFKVRISLSFSLYCFLPLFISLSLSLPSSPSLLSANVYRSWWKNICSIKLKCSFFEAESVTWLRAEIKVSTFFIFKIPCVFKTNGMSLKNTYSEFKNTSLWKIYTYTNFSSFLYTSFNNFQKGQLPVKFNLFIYKEIPKWEAQYTHWIDRYLSSTVQYYIHTWQAD